MYDWKYYNVLYSILREKKIVFKADDQLRFLLRFGANFRPLINLFNNIYLSHKYYDESVKELISILIEYYHKRSKVLKDLDNDKEDNYNWYLKENMSAMVLYIDRFNKDIKGLIEKIGYFEELGVSIIHLMPLARMRPEENDGGYAVEDYLEVNAELGSMESLAEFISLCHLKGINVVIDMVLNHTSDTHQWAVKAGNGDKEFMEYYYVFDDRTIPDLYEQSMPEVFPENAPGNFTYCPAIDKWIMTVFHNYQWDLNYTNPKVFLEVLKILLEYSNIGVDIIRLDAVAFLWKRIGTRCQNEKEAHSILQMLKAAVQIVSPSTLFIAEAIVSPDEIIKYFGGGEGGYKECDIAYNASLMVSIWDALATGNTRILTKSIERVNRKPFGTTWLNYARCHDDIGLGFSDEDVVNSGYDPHLHRKFLLDYYTGNFTGSTARGDLFMYNPETGDGRISGSLASLAGLEKALETDDSTAIETAINKILLIHSIIMSYGGIPLIYSGDEIGFCNDYSYLENENYKMDSRWLHRPLFKWDSAEKRNESGTPENKIFYGLKKMISLRKELKAFGDYNNIKVIEPENEHILAYVRSYNDESIIVLNNISAETQMISVEKLGDYGGKLVNLFTGKTADRVDDKIILPGYGFMWIRG